MFSNPGMKKNVVSYGFIVYVQYTSALFLVVAPHFYKFGGKIVIRVAGQFDDKG